MKAKHKQDGSFLYLSSVLRTNLNKVINEKWKKKVSLFGPADAIILACLLMTCNSN